MVLKWPFVDDTGEETACSLFSFPGRQSFMNQYDSFTQNMVLKRLFDSDTREASAQSLFRSPGTGLQ